MGAGDAFCGALAAKLARGASLAEAARYGNAAGALACTPRGRRALDADRRRGGSPAALARQPGCIVAESISSGFAVSHGFRSISASAAAMSRRGTGCGVAAVDVGGGAVVVDAFGDAPGAKQTVAASRIQPRRRRVRALVALERCLLAVRKNAAPICWIVTRRSRREHDRVRDVPAVEADEVRVAERRVPRLRVAARRAARRRTARRVAPMTPGAADVVLEAGAADRRQRRRRRRGRPSPRPRRTRSPGSSTRTPTTQPRKRPGPREALGDHEVALLHRRVLAPEGRRADSPRPSASSARACSRSGSRGADRAWHAFVSSIRTWSRNGIGK